MLQSEAQRQRVTTLPEVAWPSPVLTLLDQERRQRLLDEPGSRETRYYMTLSWWPPDAQHAAGGAGLLVSGDAAGAGCSRLRRRRRGSRGISASRCWSLSGKRTTFMDLLKGMLASCRPLTIDETTTYLHNCVSDRWYPLGPMAFYQDLDAQLCDTPFAGRLVSPGTDPRRRDLAPAHLLDYGLSREVRGGHRAPARRGQPGLSLVYALGGPRKAGAGRAAAQNAGRLDGPGEVAHGAHRRKHVAPAAAHPEYRCHEQGRGSGRGAAGSRGRHRGLWRIYQHRDGLGYGPRPGRDEAAPRHADARQSGLYGDGGTAARHGGVALQSAGQPPG